MKRVIFLLLAVAVVAIASSCSKEEIVSITGHYRYDGNLPSVLDIKDYYDFNISEDTMIVKGMWADDTKTFSYTRKGNNIKISPALGGTVSSAKIVMTSDGFGLKLDDDQRIYFTVRR